MSIQKRVMCQWNYGNVSARKQKLPVRFLSCLPYVIEADGDKLYPLLSSHPSSDCPSSLLTLSILGPVVRN